MNCSARSAKTRMHNKRFENKRCAPRPVSSNVREHMNVLRHLIFCIIALAVISGCSALRLTTPFPDNHTKPNRALSHEPLWLPSASFSNGPHSFNPLVRDIQRVSVFESVAFLSTAEEKNGYVLVSVNESRVPDGMFPCGEPIHVIITLGIIPAVCEITHKITLSIQSVATGKVVPYEYEYTEKSIGGWVAVIYRLFPSWVSDEENINRRVALLERVLLSKRSLLMEP